MREALRQLLMAGVPEVEGRVLEPHMGGRETPKPFLIALEGEQDPASEWADLSTSMLVIPHVVMTTYVTVDQLVAEVVATLDGARFEEGGVQYLARHEGTSREDEFDEEWEAITREVRFAIFALGWTSGLTYEPDPVAVLRDWCANSWPGQVQTDPVSWEPSDATPAIYWRLAGLPSIERTNWGAWVDGQLRCHVIAPSRGVRLTWLRRLVEGLSLIGRLTMSDRGPLYLETPSAESEADPMTRGQIGLPVRWGVLRTSPAYELLQHAYINGMEA